MIPVSLRLRNFMCYREGLPPLEFGDIHVACLSGANGAGKSALLDAMTWAVWGRARVRSDDDLIATGSQEMEVEFEFLLEGERYRVFRRRDRAARSGRGKSQLDLQVLGSDGWRSMSGESIRQTEAAIVNLLRMDYDTFINSAFLLQGRADEFTVKPPAERKRILIELLGLSRYDALEQRARRRLRAAEQSLHTLAGRLASMEQALSRRAEHEESLKQAQADAEGAEAEVAQHQGDVAQFRSQVAGLEETARQAADLRRRGEQISGEIRQLSERIGQQQDRLASLHTLLEQATEIEAQYERLQTLRSQNEALAQAASRMLSLSRRQRELEQAVDRVRQEYATEQEVLRRDLGQIEQRLQGRPATDQHLHQAGQDLAAMQEKEQELDQVRAEIQTLVIEEGTLQATPARLREELEQLQADQSRLNGDITQCPLCESTLSPEAHRHVMGSYEVKVRQRQEEIQQCEERLAEVRALLAGLRKQQSALERSLRGRQDLLRRLAALEQEQRSLAQLAEEKKVKRAQLQDVEHVLEEEDFAHDTRLELTNLLEEMAGLRYDQEEHQSVQRELNQLREVESEYQRLRTAEEGLPPAEQRLEELTELRQARETEGQAIRQQLAKLEEQVQDLPVLQRQLQEAASDLAQAQSVLGQARVALGAAQRELERLDEMGLDYQSQMKAHQEAQAQQEIYQELTQALGKKGVQAMLIETSVPEIEREANDLLNGMTDGAMALQMTMQRATKGGDGVVETLDINITDGQGRTRDFDSFSGGERFRISFALRIALSRLLARRAGASLQTLVIDEGFGTQDDQGRDRVVEAIRSVQDQFEKVLVITHIDELKEMFPTRIEVEKHPDGSAWQVV